jgi:hypothetical protein
MRQKLKDKYQKEREEYCEKIINILQLDDNHCFLLCDLDENVEKQNELLIMKDEIKKYFTVSDISTFKPNCECKKPYLNMVRSILRQQNYTVDYESHIIKYENNLFKKTIKYRIFRNI